MSWSIHYTGTRDAVARQVKQRKMYDGASEGEVAQLEAAKGFILEQLSRNDANEGVEAGTVSGVKVEANGHYGGSTSTSNSVSILVTVVPLSLS